MGFNWSFFGWGVKSTPAIKHRPNSCPTLLLQMANNGRLIHEQNAWEYVSEHGKCCKASTISRELRQLAASGQLIPIYPRAKNGRKTVVYVSKN